MSTDKIPNFSSFGNFTNIDGNKAIFNVRKIKNPMGSGSIDMVENFRKVSHHVGYVCNYYPKPKTILMTNSNNRINEVNEFIPVNGDLVFGYNPEYYQKTGWTFQGMTIQRVNRTAEYEADLAKKYLIDFMKDDRNGKTIKKIMSDHSTRHGYDIYNLNDNTTQTDGTLIPATFLAFDRQTNLIDKWIQFYFLDDTKRFDNLIKKLKNDKDAGNANPILTDETEIDFKADLEEMNMKMLSCLSLKAMVRKIDFLGVCTNSVKRNTSIKQPYLDVTTRFYGEGQIYLLSPNVKKGSKFSLYFYQTVNGPVKILVEDTYKKIQDIKNLLGDVPTFYPTKDVVKVVRGQCLGMIRDSGSLPNYSVEDFYRMQLFPWKEKHPEVTRQSSKTPLDIKIKDYTGKDLMDLLHRRNWKRVVMIDNTIRSRSSNYFLK